MTSQVPQNPKKVLFVCTGNSCRSVIAAGLFKKMVQDAQAKMEVQSAGIVALQGMGATPETIRVLDAEGVDVRGHQPRRVNVAMIREADLVLVMERFHRDHVLTVAPEAAGKVFLLGDFNPSQDEASAEVEIPDPIGMGDDVYEDVTRFIKKSLEVLWEKIRSQ